jgi:hypothetical protein
VTPERDAHPSLLALDRFALGATSAAVSAHVQGCDSCRAHVEQVGAPGPGPAWARALGERESAPPRRRTWLAGLTFGVAALAGVVLVATRPHVADPSYVGAKGGPELWLHVNRDGKVRRWDGKESVRPGDGLRLEIQGAGFRHVNVFAPVAAAPGYERLYAGALGGAGRSALPVAWTVDERPGDERLLVILAPAEIAPQDVGRLLARANDGSFWTRTLVLPKRAP